MWKRTRRLPEQQRRGPERGEVHTWKRARDTRVRQQRTLLALTPLYIGERLGPAVMVVASREARKESNHVQSAAYTTMRNATVNTHHAGRGQWIISRRTTSTGDDMMSRVPGPAGGASRVRLAAKQASLRRTRSRDEVDHE